MIEVLAVATQAAERSGGMGWQWIPGLVGGGGLAGIVVMLVKQKLFSGTFRIGGGADSRDANGSPGEHSPCATVLRLQTEHDNLVKDVGTMKTDIGVVKGGIGILVQLKTGKPLEQSVAENKTPPVQT